MKALIISKEEAKSTHAPLAASPFGGSKGARRLPTSAPLSGYSLMVPHGADWVPLKMTSSTTGEVVGIAIASVSAGYVAVHLVDKSEDPREALEAVCEVCGVPRASLTHGAATISSGRIWCTWKVHHG